MRKNLLLTAGFLIMVAACSFAPKDTGRAYMFALQPARMAEHTPVSDSLTVVLPSAAPELDGFRIALIKDGGRWDYYAGARWADFLPLIVQDNLTKTLEDAKLFQAVHTDQSGGRGDVALKTEIRSFQAEYEPGQKAPKIKIKMVVKLMKRIEGTLDVFDLKAETRAARDSLPDIQTAFARAFNDIQKQLVNKLQTRAAKP